MARFHFIRGQELQRLQTHPLAARELQTLAPLPPNTTSVRYFLATLFASSEEHAAVLRLLSGIIDAVSPAEVRGVTPHRLDVAVSTGVGAGDATPEPTSRAQPVRRVEYDATRKRV